MSRIIPFNLLPAAWGLKGKSYDLAKAHYELEGYDLEVRLAEIEKTGADLARELADIDHRHGVLPEYEWMKRHIEIETEGRPVDREVELTKLGIEFGKIQKREGEKKIADLLGEPWVGIVDEGLNPAEGPNGFYFEFDWNDKWIEQLRAAGFTGVTEEDIMEEWFTAVCRDQSHDPEPLPPIGPSISVIYDS